MPLGSETYGNPVCANGKVYVGTNNASGYLSRYPANIDLGVERMRTAEPDLAAAVREGRVEVVGAYYDLATGEVRFSA